MKRWFIAFAFIILLTACAQQGTVGGSLQIQTKQLPNWVSGSPSTFKVSVTGGTPPYSFKISGSLPPGFNFGPDGTIGGTGSLPPGTSKKTYPTFTITVTDSKGDSAEQSLTINVVEPSISINTVTATCIVKQRCDELITTAQGGNSPYSFQSDTFAEGAPPMGMIVDINGHITGTATKEGEYTVGVCAKDTNGNSKCGHATVIVRAGAMVEGTWSGKYSGTESFGPCVMRNDGILTFSLTEKDGTFSGSLDDTGNSESNSDQCSASSYHLSGTVSGTISGNVLTGTMKESGPGMDYNVPFTATVAEGTMTGSYTGAGEFSDGGSSSVYGSFKLTKK